MPDQDSVYVVTRGGRRIEPTNYNNPKLAQKRASSLIEAIQSWDKPSLASNSVKIVKTISPHRIR